MRKLRIGIDSEVFSGWNGGIDFIAMLAEALESTGKVETFLLIPTGRKRNAILQNLKYSIFPQWTPSKNKLMKKNVRCSITYSFKTCTPATKIVYYYVGADYSQRDKKKEICCVNKHIDLLLPSASCISNDFAIPRIGYIHDFQHKYFPELFGDESCRKIDMDFKNRLEKCKYLIVNAEAVKRDIDRFYPKHESEIIVLPFKPFQKPIVSSAVDLSHYNLPLRYYVVCNQFWMHKNHITVFDALEEVYNRGIQSLHLVCTGLLDDYRNPAYGEQIREKINSLNCKNNIHIVGFIPKDDQIEMMKNAIGLIQPTLFEGGPGGGATYNAICLGLPILLSDIPVNREVVGVDNVVFFEAQNTSALAELMTKHMEDKRRPDEETNNFIEANKREYGEILLDKLVEIIEKEK